MFVTPGVGESDHGAPTPEGAPPWLRRRPGPEPFRRDCPEKETSPSVSVKFSGLSSKRELWLLGCPRERGKRGPLRLVTGAVPGTAEVGPILVGPDKVPFFDRPPYSTPVWLSTRPGEGCRQ